MTSQMHPNDVIDYVKLSYQQYTNEHNSILTESK